MNAETIMERLGKVEGRVEEHSLFFPDINQRFTAIENRFNHVEHKLDRLDEKIDRVYAELSGKVEAVHRGLDSKTDRVYNELNAKIDALDHKLSDRMDRYFIWMMGLMITGWGSVFFQLIHK